MCGITGFYNLNNIDLLRKMSNRISHRGPDSSGIAQFPNAGLAHQRLSIIDLSETGNQPMYDDSGRYSIVYNGEVYNFRQLRNTLVEKGIHFKSTSDTEVILKYFIEFGTKGLVDFNGMFAFALYDEKLNQLWLCRDRFGIKPLYYIQIENKLYFSSEIKAFYEIPDLMLSVDKEALFYYLRFQYVPSPLTMYNEVKKLQPGHYLAISGTGMITEKYWELEPASNRDIDTESAILETGNLLEKSVEKHLIADVPVGVFLSGGLDSSLIASIANQKVKGLNTFSIVFENSPKEDESEFSRKVAGLLKTNHHEFSVKPEMGEEVFEDVVYQMDEPVGDPALLPTYILSRETAKHIKVVLNGEGADEIFAGYKQYKLDPFVNFKLTEIAALLFSKSGLDQTSFNLQRLTRAAISVSDYKRRQEYAAVFSNETASELIGNKLSGTECFLKMPVASKSLDGLNNWLLDDMRYWLPDDLLMKADKMMMKFSLEGRVPFLENDLFDYSNTLSSSLKLRGSSGKWILRKIAQKYLPDDIVYRKKHGFNVPVGKWFRGPLSGFVLSSIENLKIIPGFNLEKSKEIVRLHMEGKYDYSRQIYILLNLAIWLKQNENRISFEGSK